MSYVEAGWGFLPTQGRKLRSANFVLRNIVVMSMRELRTMRSIGVMIVCACGGAGVKDTAQADAQLVVLDIGGLPRHRLRLQPVLHAKERFAAEVQTRLEGAYTDATFQTRQSSGSVPTIRLTGTREVTAIAPTGDALVTERIDGAAGTASWRVSPVGARHG